MRQFRKPAITFIVMVMALMATSLSFANEFGPAGTGIPMTRRMIIRVIPAASGKAYAPMIINGTLAGITSGLFTGKLPWNKCRMRTSCGCRNQGRLSREVRRLFRQPTVMAMAYRTARIFARPFLASSCMRAARLWCQLTATATV